MASKATAVTFLVLMLVAAVSAHSSRKMLQLTQGLSGGASTNLQSATGAAIGRSASDIEAKATRTSSTSPSMKPNTPTTAVAKAPKGTKGTADGEGAQNVATATSAAIGQKADGAATKATPSAAAVPSKAIPATDRTGSKSGTGMAQASQSATAAAISQKADGTTKTTTPTSKVTTGAAAATANAKKLGP